MLISCCFNNPMLLWRCLMRFIAWFVMMALLNTGCASIFHGTKETIHVRSDEPDTHFYADSRDIGKGTSAVTTLPKNSLSHAVLRAEKPGCNTKSAPIETEFDGVTLLGILIDFGIISILVIDWAANGAVTKASQTDYILTPDCPKQQPQTQTSAKPL